MQPAEQGHIFIELAASAWPRCLRCAAPAGHRTDLLGALFVADFQVLELREVGKLLAGNAHWRAGLSQGGDELVGLLLARIDGVETHERLDRDLGIFLLPFRNGR